METWHVALLPALGQARKPSLTPATPTQSGQLCILTCVSLLYTEALQEAKPQGLEPRTYSCPDASC